MSRFKNLDALDMEFQYYSCLIKDFFLLLPNRCDQKKTNAWFRKLSEPAYNVDALREKRNHYLLMLIICMTLNGLKHPFNKYPPLEPLKEVTNIVNPKILEPFTQSGYQATPPMQEGSQKCDLHETVFCPEDTENIGKVLDEQFRFLIKLAEPLVSKLSDPSDRRRGRIWIIYLSSLTSKCFHLKGVRNEYTMLLTGYLMNDELPGPFLYLPIGKLVPLEDLVTIMDMGNHMIFDPIHPKTLKFFKDVPQPDEGVFAFFSLSGRIE